MTLVWYLCCYPWTGMGLELEEGHYPYHWFHKNQLRNKSPNPGNAYTKKTHNLWNLKNQILVKYGSHYGKHRVKKTCLTVHIQNHNFWCGWSSPSSSLLCSAFSLLPAMVVKIDEWTHWKLQCCQTLERQRWPKELSVSKFLKDVYNVNYQKTMRCVCVCGGGLSKSIKTLSLSTLNFQMASHFFSFKSACSTYSQPRLF